MIGVSTGLPVLRFHKFYCADGFFPDLIFDISIKRLVLDPVADHQLYAGGFTGFNHFAALVRTYGHWFLTKDVLPGFGTPDGEFLVHAVRKNDENGIYIIVIGDFIKIFIRIL